MESAMTWFIIFMLLALFIVAYATNKVFPSTDQRKRQKVSHKSTFSTQLEEIDKTLKPSKPKSIRQAIKDEIKANIIELEKKSKYGKAYIDNSFLANEIDYLVDQFDAFNTTEVDISEIISYIQFRPNKNEIKAECVGSDILQPSEFNALFSYLTETIVDNEGSLESVDDFFDEEFDWIFDIDKLSKRKKVIDSGFITITEKELDIYEQLQHLTIPKLKSILNNEGIKLKGATKKDDIIARIIDTIPEEVIIGKYIDDYQKYDSEPTDKFKEYVACVASKIKAQYDQIIEHFGDGILIEN